MPVARDRVTVDDGKCLAVGRALLALVEALGLTAPATASTYDSTNLPPGTTRDAFMRRHRDRIRRGVDGWTRAGIGRCVTLEAWDLDVANETATARARPKRKPPNASGTVAANDIDADLDVQLGIRTRGAR